MIRGDYNIFSKELSRIVQKYSDSNTYLINQVNADVQDIVKQLSAFRDDLSVKLKESLCKNHNIDDLYDDITLLNQEIDKMKPFTTAESTAQEAPLAFDEKVYVYLMSDEIDDKCTFCNCKISPYIIHYQRYVSDHLIDQVIMWHKCPQCKKVYVLNYEADEFDFSNTNIVLDKEDYREILQEMSTQTREKDDEYPFNLIKAIYIDEDMDDVVIEDDDIISYSYFGSLVDKMMETLTKRESEVLSLRYKFRMTLSQIAVDMHATREQIRQIEAKALRKLRHPSRSRRLDVIRKKRLVGIDAIWEECRCITRSEVGNEVKEKIIRICDTELPRIINEEQIEEVKRILLGTSDSQSIHIEELGLSVRSYNILKRAGIDTIADILATDLTKVQIKVQSGVATLRLIGINEIVEKMAELGYKMEVPNEKCDSEEDIN